MFFVETATHFSGFFDEYKVQNYNNYLKYFLYNITNVFSATLDQFNASLLYKSMN